MINDLTENYGYTLTSLSREMEVPFSTVSRWKNEHNKMSKIRQQQLTKIHARAIRKGQDDR